MENKVAERVANKVAKRVAKRKQIYSDGYIRKILTALKDKKLIERQGGNKTGKWVII